MCIYDPNIGEILIISVKYFWTNSDRFVPLLDVFPLPWSHITTTIYEFHMKRCAQEFGVE